MSAVLFFGGFVTYLGNAIYWDHYIRIETEAVQNWLGVPNNTGDTISTPGSPCPVCFETIYSLQWGRQHQSSKLPPDGPRVKRIPGLRNCWLVLNSFCVQALRFSICLSRVPR